jgi:hypothetical protein
MTLRLHDEALPRAAHRLRGRRRTLTARQRVAQALQTRRRRRQPPRSLRPVSYRAPRALVTLNFDAHEALGRLALLQLTSALKAPWRLLVNLARLLRTRDAVTGPEDEPRRGPHLSAAPRRVRAT